MHPVAYTFTIKPFVGKFNISYMHPVAYTCHCIYTGKHINLIV